MALMQFNGKKATLLFLNGEIIESWDSLKVSYTINDPNELHEFNSEFIYTMEKIDNGDGTYTVNIYSRNDFTSFKCNVNTITIDYLNITSNVTDMSGMFSGCTSLTSLDLSNWDTSNVTDMSEMFRHCTSLASLDLSNFDTSNVTNMNSMFTSCDKLTSLDLSSFDTGNVEYMNSMFTSCDKLTSLDVSNWNTSNVTDMRRMFQYCSSLTSLDVSSFNTSNVTDMSNMFRNCSSLTSLDVSNFDTSNVNDMSDMFHSCKMTTLDVSNFNTTKVTDMSRMFRNCSQLVTLNLQWDKSFIVYSTSGVIADYMFENCSSLTSLDLSSWHIANDNIRRTLNSMEGMFCNCKKLEEIIGIDSISTSGVGTFYSVFESCESLTSLDLSSWNTGKVEIMYHMFWECKSLASLNLSNWNTSSVKNMYGMFGYCSSLKSLVVSHFNTSIVEQMGQMFLYCSSLTSLDLSSWNTGSVKNMENIFDSCTSLTALKFTNLDTSKLSASRPLGDMFYGCTKLASLDLSNWDNTTLPKKYVVDLSYLPSIVDWWYNMDNYTNWVLTEEETGYNGEFPWNKLYTLTVKYIDKDSGQEIRDRYTEQIKVNDTYNLSKPDISGYDTWLNEDPTSGVIRGDTTVELLYRKIYYVTVNYIDTNGNIIKDSVVREVFNGWPYNVSDLDDEIIIEGYEYVRTEGSVSGTIYSADVTINVIYEKEPDYIEYTVKVASATDKVSAIAGSYANWGYKKYLPQLYSATGSKISNITIKIKKKDGTTTTDTNTLVSEVSSIVAYYDISAGQYFTFQGYSNTLHNLDTFIKPMVITSATKRLTNVFRDCGVASLDLSGWDVSQVTSMDYMFDGCTNLTTITGLETWTTTSCLTNTRCMFSDCEKLRPSLDLTRFNVDNVTDMYGMFQYCKSLKSIDLSTWDTNNVTPPNASYEGDTGNMGYMFAGIPASCNIYKGANWNVAMTPEATNFSGTFLTK